MRKELMLVMAGILVATPAAAEEWDFIITNGTGKEIKTVEVAPKGSASWIANKVDPGLSKTGAIKTGARATIHFDKAGAECSYAIKATFADDTSAVSDPVDVCDNSYVTLKAAADGKLSATPS